MTEASGVTGDETRIHQTEETIREVAKEIVDELPAREWVAGTIRKLTIQAPLQSLGKRLELSGAIDDAPTNHGQIAGEAGDLIFGARKEVAIGHDQSSELPDFDAPMRTQELDETMRLVKQFGRRSEGIKADIRDIDVLHQTRVEMR